MHSVMCIWIMVFVKSEYEQTCCCHACDAVSGGDHGGTEGSIADAPTGGRAAAGP